MNSQKIIICDNDYQMLLFLNPKFLKSYMFFADGSYQEDNAFLASTLEFLTPKFKDLRYIRDIDDEYKEYINDKTDLKYYYKNGLLNIRLFFLNNGECALNFIDYQPFLVEPLIKRFKCGSKMITCSLVAVAMLFSLAGCTQNTQVSDADSSVVIASEEAENEDAKILRLLGSTTDYSPETLQTFLQAYKNLEWYGASPEYLVRYFKDLQYYLDNEITFEDIEKWVKEAQLDEIAAKYYLNRDYWEVVGPYVNSTPYSRLMFALQNRYIGLQCMQTSMSNLGGYVIAGDPAIYLLDFNENFISWAQKYFGTYLHETKHKTLIPTNYYFGVIIEGMADLEKEEFDLYGGTYIHNMIITKILILTLGSDPLMQYLHAGNAIPLLNLIYDNLTEEEAYELLSLLNVNIRESDGYVHNSKTYFVPIMNLLGKLYANIHGEPITNNRGIVALLLSINDSEELDFMDLHQNINVSTHYEVHQSYLNPKNSTYDNPFAVIPYTKTLWNDEIEHPTTTQIINIGTYDFTADNYNCYAYVGDNGEIRNDGDSIYYLDFSQTQKIGLSPIVLNLESEKVK